MDKMLPTYCWAREFVDKDDEFMSFYYSALARAYIRVIS
jgi:hypothetical protein